jgi:hypothetical protein
MAANVLLVAFYAVEAGRIRVLPVSLGSANDVVGSVSTALMVPVALAVSPNRWTRRLSLTATGTHTLAGPALVLGLVSFAVQMPIAIGAFEGLAAWILLSSRGVLGWLTVPVWFMRLGRALSSDVLPRRSLDDVSRRPGDAVPPMNRDDVRGHTWHGTRT